MPGKPFTIAEKLQGFVAKWKGYGGNERQGAQPFLYNLLDIYEVEYVPGAVFEQHPVRMRASSKHQGQDLFFPVEEQMEYAAQSMDMYIPKICVWEMKGPGEELSKHHTQILGYWAKMRPRYMVLCNFNEFWIYDTDEENGQNVPKFRFTIADLPAQWQALLFLRGEESHFPQRAERVTREMASRIGKLVRELFQASGRTERDRERITKFGLEFVFAMFAEDSELIPKGMFAQTLEAARRLGRLDPVYNLFDDFGRERAEDRSNPFAPFVDGSLYDREHPKIALSQDQIDSLYAAARDFDWQDVRPEIFGSIFEQALDPADRHELGAHFTREEDILKVVLPTVLEPWRERIGATRKPKDVIAAVEAMKAFHVLDPACGCGNFLYVVYREMKRLEASLRDRWKIVHTGLVKRRRDIPPPPPGPYFNLYQLHGIEINSFAAQLSRVVLWIGEHLAQRELSLEEETLPLKNLDAVIENRDALLSDWPRGEGELSIVGNPPYLGVRKMRLELGDDYVEDLFRRYPDNRTADYVTYWFPQALETLKSGERCGFVTTNSIAQNESREASIDKVLAAGGNLTDVWKSYPWPGEAAVHVSIVNFTMGGYDGIKKLDGETVARINSRLSTEVQVTDARTISSNEGLSFMGVTPGNKEFILDAEQRSAIIEKDPKSEEVIKPFLIGRDLNREIEQKPTRWIIDFGMMDREEAETYTAAFRYVQTHVYPLRMKNRRESYVKYWWRFVEPRSGMRRALEPVKRFIAISRVGPHVYFNLIGISVLPDCQLIVLVLDSPYSFGILHSRIHEIWAWTKGSTFKGDLRYTPTTIFETFPFPQLPKGFYDPRKVPKTPEAKAVSECAETLYKRRAALCKERELGLTKIYNLMKAGELPELEELHNRLNDAVTACYGWPEGTWRDDNQVLSRLLELNLRLTGGE